MTGLIVSQFSGNFRISHGYLLGCGVRQLLLRLRLLKIMTCNDDILKSRRKDKEERNR